jgi:hypothetical protein
MAMSEKEYEKLSNTHPRLRTDEQRAALRKEQVRRGVMKYRARMAKGLPLKQPRLASKNKVRVKVKVAKPVKKAAKPVEKQPKPKLKLHAVPLPKKAPPKAVKRPKLKVKLAPTPKPHAPPKPAPKSANDAAKLHKPDLAAVTAKLGELAKSAQATA